MYWPRGILVISFAFIDLTLKCWQGRTRWCVYYCAGRLKVFTCWTLLVVGKRPLSTFPCARYCLATVLFGKPVEPDRQWQQYIGNSNIANHMKIIFIFLYHKTRTHAHTQVRVWERAYVCTFTIAEYTLRIGYVNEWARVKGISKTVYRLRTASRQLSITLEMVDDAKNPRVSPRPFVWSGLYAFWECNWTILYIHIKTFLINAEINCNHD